MPAYRICNISCFLLGMPFNTGHNDTVALVGYAGGSCDKHDLGLLPVSVGMGMKTRWRDEGTRL